MAEEALQQETDTLIGRYRALSNDSPIVSRDGYAHDASIGAYWVFSTDENGDGPQVLIHGYAHDSIDVLEKFRDKNFCRKLEKARKHVHQSRFDSKLLDDPDIRKALDLRVVATRQSPQGEWYASYNDENGNPVIYENGTSLLADHQDDHKQMVMRDGTCYLTDIQPLQEQSGTYCVYKNSNFSFENWIYAGNAPDGGDNAPEHTLTETQNKAATGGETSGGSVSLFFYPAHQAAAQRFVQTRGDNPQKISDYLRQGMRITNPDSDDKGLPRFNDAMQHMIDISRHFCLNMYYRGVPYTASDYFRTGGQLLWTRSSQKLSEKINEYYHYPMLMIFDPAALAFASAEKITEAASIAFKTGRVGVRDVIQPGYYAWRKRQEAENDDNTSSGKAAQKLVDRLDFTIPREFTQHGDGEDLNIPRKALRILKTSIFGNYQSILARRGHNIVSPDVLQELHQVPAYNAGIIPQEQIYITDPADPASERADNNTRRQQMLAKLYDPFDQNLGSLIDALKPYETSISGDTETDCDTAGEDTEKDQTPDTVPQSLSIYNSSGLASHYIPDDQDPDGQRFKLLVRYDENLQSDKAPQLSEEMKELLQEGYALEIRQLGENASDMSYETRALSWTQFCNEMAAGAQNRKWLDRLDPEDIAEQLLVSRDEDATPEIRIKKARPTVSPNMMFCL